MRFQQLLTAALFVVALTDARRAAPAAVPKKPFGVHKNPYCFGRDSLPKNDEKVVKEVKAGTCLYMDLLMSTTHR